MTPFIIWLAKEDIDNLITMIVKSGDLENLKYKNFIPNELFDFVKELINQNNELLKLLKKIELKRSNYKISLQEIKTHQKCSFYQQHLNEILEHCNLHNKNFKHAIDSLKLLGCEQCTLRNRYYDDHKGLDPSSHSF